MRATRKDAENWIRTQDTGYARTMREKAKYLAGKLTAHETPHPAVWHRVLRIAADVREQCCSESRKDGCGLTEAQKQAAEEMFKNLPVKEFRP